MSIKYWEFEDAPLKEKLKSVNIKDIAKVFFDNETEAYRFASLLLEVKKNKQLKLRQVPKNIPLSTAKRYLDFAVEVGMLKHEDNNYMLTDRFTKPFRNIATYIKAWMDSASEEDLAVEFANARIDRQDKRGGKAAVQEAQAEKSKSQEEGAHQE